MLRDVNFLYWVTGIDLYYERVVTLLNPLYRRPSDIIVTVSTMLLSLLENFEKKKSIDKRVCISFAVSRFYKAPCKTRWYDMCYALFV